MPRLLPSQVKEPRPSAPGVTMTTCSPILSDTWRIAGQAQHVLDQASKPTATAPLPNGTSNAQPATALPFPKRDVALRNSARHKMPTNMPSQPE